MAEFVDAAAVATAGEFGGEERGDAGLGHVLPGQACAQGDDIGVVMLAREHRRIGFADQRAADGGMAVYGDGYADARAADRDAALRLARGDRLGKLVAEIGIIDAIGRGGAEIGDIVPGLAQPRGERGLQLDGGVIGGDGDADDRCSSDKGRRMRALIRKPAANCHRRC